MVFACDVWVLSLGEYAAIKVSRMRVKTLVKIHTHHVLETDKKTKHMAFGHSLLEHTPLIGVFVAVFYC